MKMQAIPAAALATFALPSLHLPPLRCSPSPDPGPQDALSVLIDRSLRSRGSWFTPAERAVIGRKCGYAPGEWEGFEANLSRGTLPAATAAWPTMPRSALCSGRRRPGSRLGSRR